MADLKAEQIKADFRNRVSDKIDLIPEGLNRFRVLTPFQFGDQDHLGIFLKREGEEWILSDEGSTFMHLTYDVAEADLQKGSRQRIIDSALSLFTVIDREGELVLRVPDARFGDSLFDFVQAILRITDVSYLSRERIRTTFIDDFRKVVKSSVPSDRLSFKWHDQKRDPSAKYLADCRVNGMEKPIFLFALSSDQQVRDATITLLQFERWYESRFQSIGIFEEQEEITRKVLARFSDHCDKQFSSLAGENQGRVATYIEKLVR